MFYFNILIAMGEWGVLNVGDDAFIGNDKAILVVNASADKAD